MPADSYYEDLNERLAGEQFCVGENDRESTEDEALEAIELGAAEEEVEQALVRDELDKALRDYAASVKRYGKALVNLGRKCDAA